MDAKGNVEAKFRWHINRSGGKMDLFGVHETYEHSREQAQGASSMIQYYRMTLSTLRELHSSPIRRDTCRASPSKASARTSPASGV